MALFWLLLLLGGLLGRTTDAATYGPAAATAVTTGSAWLDPTAGTCSGTYNKTARNCSGSDGDAFPTMATFLAGCGCGETCLMRAGSYTLPNTPQSLSNCTSGAVRVINVYNKEAVTVTGSWGMNNWNELRGFTSHGAPSGNGNNFRFGAGSNGSKVVNVRCHTRTIAGSICVSTDPGAGSWQVTGSHLSLSQGSTNELVKNMGWCGGYFADNKLEDLTTSGAQDLLTAETDWVGCLSNPSIIERNWFVNSTEENHIDLKVAKSGAEGHIIFRNNYLDGTGIGAEACAILWGQRANTNIIYDIENNFFDRCDARAINLNGGHSDTTPDGYIKGNKHRIKGNLFKCSTPDSATTTLDIGIDDVIWEHNTIQNCSIDLHSGGGVAPQGGTWRSNILSNVQIVGNPAGAVTCTDNVVHSSDAFPFGCTAGSTANPQFVSASNWNIQNAALFLAGHDGEDPGAMARPRLSTCNIGQVAPTTMEGTYTSRYAPLVVTTPSNLQPKKGGTVQTVSGTSVQGQTRVQMTVPPYSAGDDADLALAASALRNTQCLGGPEACLHGINALTADTQCTNTVSSGVPTFTCHVGDETRNIARVTVDMKGAPPLQLGACPTGWNVQDDGVNQTETGCVPVASGVFDLTLAAPLTTGTNQVSYNPATGSTTNGASVEVGSATVPCTTTIGTSPPDLVAVQVFNTDRTQAVFTFDLGNGTTLLPATGLTGLSIPGMTPVACVRQGTTQAVCTYQAAFLPPPTTYTASYAPGNLTDDALVPVAAIAGLPVTNEVQVDAGTVTLIRSGAVFADEPEATARWVCAEVASDTAPACPHVAPGGKVRILVQLRCDGTCPAANYVPTVGWNGGTPEAIGNTFGSQGVQLGTDAAVDNLALTSTRLTACTGTNVPGRVYLNPLEEFPSIALAHEECVQYAYNVEFVSAAAPGGLYAFGMQVGGGGNVVQLVPMTLRLGLGGGVR